MGRASRAKQIPRVTPQAVPKPVQLSEVRFLRLKTAVDERRLFAVEAQQRLAVLVEAERAALLAAGLDTAWGYALDTQTLTATPVRKAG